MKKLFLLIVFCILFSSFAFAWQDTNYDYCKPINVTNPSGGALTDYPALLNVSWISTMGTSMETINIYSGGCDGSGSQLAWELDYINTTDANAYLWVRIPTFSTGINEISIFYNNNTGVSSTENQTGTWDDYYKAVWHGNQYNSTHMEESTQYSNPF